MASLSALDFTYHYPFASAVEPQDDGLGVRLATCGAKREHPLFFDGCLREPRAVGDMLLVLSQVVRTHLFQPRRRIGCGKKGQAADPLAEACHGEKHKLYIGAYR
ncbi:MAG: hypothetical protein GXY83_22070 [Rhodopirellula sp.]|nr:hypothetical protein [Rhodopirellula sp.]